MVCLLFWCKGTTFFSICQIFQRKILKKKKSKHFPLGRNSVTSVTTDFERKPMANNIYYYI